MAMVFSICVNLFMSYFIKNKNFQRKQRKNYILNKKHNRQHAGSNICTKMFAYIGIREITPRMCIDVAQFFCTG